MPVQIRLEGGKVDRFPLRESTALRAALGAVPIDAVVRGLDDRLVMMRVCTLLRTEFERGARTARIEHEHGSEQSR